MALPPDSRMSRDTWQSERRSEPRSIQSSAMEASGVKRGLPESAAPPPKKANSAGAAAAGSAQQVGTAHTTRRIKPLRA